MEKIIEEIREACSGLFLNGIYFTKLNRTYIIQGNSPAINNYNGINEQINVLQWLDNFFIYIVINLIPQTIDSKFPKGFDEESYFNSLKEKYLNIGDDFFNVVITISVFQGGQQCDKKKQLFRAEWDNYGGTQIHPQPHWHFYPEEKILDDFADENTDFLEDELQKEIDLKRVHFALNGMWAHNGSHIHQINNKDALVRWFVGILSHIKDQLKETKTMKH